MDPFFHTGLSISDSLKTVRKSVLIYETIIDLQDYFESKSWYKGTVKPSDFDESVLNKYEKANIDLISSME